MKIAVAGPKGRLGSWLVEQENLIALGCDIAKPKEVDEELLDVAPDVVINAAAWTAVDEAEDPKNYERVMAVNLRGPYNLRRAFDGLLIQVSTGFVFNGRNGPYKEDELPEPVNIYGWSKMGGEIGAQVRQPTIIVRVLDLFGPDDTKTDFVRQVRDLLEIGVEEKKLPDNLYGTPTYIPHLSEALLVIADRWGDWKTFTSLNPGPKPQNLHVAGDLTLSRFEWGRMIAEHFGYDPLIITPTSEIVGKAQRPLRGGLSVEYAKSMEIPIYSPADGLAALSAWEQARVEPT